MQINSISIVINNIIDIISSGKSCENHITGEIKDDNRG